jgi:hypothetical protein
MRFGVVAGLWLGCFSLACFALGCGDDAAPARDAGTPGPGVDGGSSTGGDRNPTCTEGKGTAEVASPVHVRNLEGETSWYASPVVIDLDGDGENELVAAYYSVFVFDSSGELVAQAEGGEDRVYAPHVVVDLEGDGLTEVVYGNSHEVYAYEWRDGTLALKDGWPASTTTAENAPEVRGLAASDLDGDGLIEIVATTTQTERTEDGGAQVFVFSRNGTLFRPAGVEYDAWPRYNARTGAGGDAHRNGMGHHGYGCYGLNAGIGNIDDDADLEVLVTYDNHHIQAFDRDGSAIDAAPWFRNRDSDFEGMPMTWGQFIRWADPEVERAHYHDHEGEWPHPATEEWLQWTASPPSVVDLDGDGENEVVGVPNVERNEPYETQAFAIMALDGAYGDGSRSAMRHAGWETLPRGDAPILVDGYYPPLGMPAPAIANIQGDSHPEIVVSLNDGFLHAFSHDARELWRFDYRHGKPLMYASEPTFADLNDDGSPEVVFATYGDPDSNDSGNLVILGADGSLLHDVPLPNAGHNGNGNGAPAAPGIGDLDGDGELDIFVQTFDHGMDWFTVPGSRTGCLLWPTARGGPLRTGRPNGA